MAAIFGEGKFFFKLPRVHCSDTLWVENFGKIALSRTVKEIEGRHFWGGEIFFLNCKEYNAQIPYLWVENFDEIALSRTVKEIEANLQI